MKIRCTQDSIRYRLRKSDIVALERDNFVMEFVRFPAGVPFKFCLIIDKTISTLAASFQEGTISIFLPEQQALSWINSDVVALETRLITDQPSSLHILVEKDFPCRHTQSNIADTFFELAPKDLV